MVFGFLNESILQESLRQASCWESERLSSPAPSRQGQRGNYIIWRWNESTLQAKVSEMLYCSQNCQLKSNTWNTEARLKTASPLLPETGRSPAPQRPPENVFLSIFFFFPFYPVFICEKLPTMHLHIGLHSP